MNLTDINPAAEVDLTGIHALALSWPGLSRGEIRHYLRRNTLNTETYRNENLMQHIINQLAQTKPDLDREAFETAYKAKRVIRSVATPDELRKAYVDYKTAARKIKRVKEQRDGTTGPDRIPR